MLEQVGYEKSEIEEILENGYAFEKKIASAIMSTAELYEADALERMLNKVTLKELAEMDYDAFFRAYAEVWKSMCTREYSEYIVYQDAHPAEYLRVNVTLMQMPEFYETYGIKEGDGMYMAEEERIAVW